LKGLPITNKQNKCAEYLKDISELEYVSNAQSSDRSTVGRKMVVVSRADCPRSRAQGKPKLTFGQMNFSP
jgi:hypothetical protein